MPRMKLLLGLLAWMGLCFANTNAATKTLSTQNQLEQAGLINTVIANARQGLALKQKPKGADGAILFVSFSMPEALLYSLAEQAAFYDIPLVINGLVDGDFKKTIETFKRLNAKNPQLSGISIDPVWFTQFQINSVPALVVTDRPKNCLTQDCSLQPFDVVYGNARLKDALELIIKKGDAASLRAKTILEHGHG